MQKIKLYFRSNNHHKARNRYQNIFTINFSSWMAIRSTLVFNNLRRKMPKEFKINKKRLHQDSQAPVQLKINCNSLLSNRSRAKVINLVRVLKGKEACKDHQNNPSKIIKRWYRKMMNLLIPLGCIFFLTAVSDPDPKAPTKLLKRILRKLKLDQMCLTEPRTALVKINTILMMKVK